MTAQTKITPASARSQFWLRSDREIAATHLPKEPVMAKLEDALKDLAVEHRLTALSVNLYARADGTTWFGACAHSGGLCAHDDLSMASNASDAIKSAIDVLNAKRVAPVVVPDLEIAA